MSIAHRSGRQRLRSADLSRRARRGGRGTPHQPLRVVALGGGHGLAANLRALRLLADDITAVVTVADNGGSSGRIRTEMPRSEEHTSELQSRGQLVCRLLLEKQKDRG